MSLCWSTPCVEQHMYPNTCNPASGAHAGQSATPTIMTPPIGTCANHATYQYRCQPAPAPPWPNDSLNGDVTLTQTPTCTTSYHASQGPTRSIHALPPTHLHQLRLGLVQLARVAAGNGLPEEGLGVAGVRGQHCSRRREARAPYLLCDAPNDRGYREHCSVVVVSMTSAVAVGAVWRT